MLIEKYRDKIKVANTGVDDEDYKILHPETSADVVQTETGEDAETRLPVKVTLDEWKALAEQRDLDEAAGNMEAVEKFDQTTFIVTDDYGDGTAQSSEFIKLSSYAEWEEKKAAGELKPGKYYVTPDSESSSLIDDGAARSDKTYSSKRIEEIISATRQYDNISFTLDAATPSYRLEDPWITPQTFAFITLSDSSISIAKESGLTAETVQGALLFSAQKLPQQEILCSVLLVKGANE
ncbi:hypothetical protein [Anaerolentibacter hominis]|uniref:hypothetical protein n=1 Tax=Anaerolentibacter hominis TaxID=3079009 RepID=UPI0031B7F176